jgi:hypothetical protein
MAEPVGQAVLGKDADDLRPAFDVAVEVHRECLNGKRNAVCSSLFQCGRYLNGEWKHSGT